MADHRMKVSQQQATLVFSDLVDSLIVDIATEAHRAARLGFDYKLNVEEEEEVRLAAHARAVVGDSGVTGNESGNKHTVDVFGQTHPTIANETFECMNCGRPIVAGRFAPHLEKCMGKGRKARIKASRNLSTNQQRRARSSSVSSFGAAASAAATAGRAPSRTSNRFLEDIHRESADTIDGESEESHDDDDKDLSYGLYRTGKPRLKRCPGGISKNNPNFPQLGAFEFVPVPLHVSPLRASCAASVASLAKDASAGSVVGLTVEVAVQQLDSFDGGRVPFSGNKVAKRSGKMAVGRGIVNRGRTGETRNFDNSLTKCRRPEKCHVFGRGKMDCPMADTSNLPQKTRLKNNSLEKLTTDSSSDANSQCGRSCLKDVNLEQCTADSTSSTGKKVVESSPGNGKEQSDAEFDMDVGIGKWIYPEMHSNGSQARSEVVDFERTKKRPRATFKPIHRQMPMCASASVRMALIKFLNAIRKPQQL